MKQLALLLNGRNWTINEAKTGCVKICVDMLQQAASLLLPQSKTCRLNWGDVRFCVVNIV